MVKREFWLHKINKALQHRSILWLTGVRRVGKTSLCKSIKGAIYFDCELPSVRQQIEDPEQFFADLRNKTLILDEIHRLSNPSEVIKIAADHFPDIKIIATGSSTLGVSAKFKDTLTGRKTTLRLTPILCAELTEFANQDINHRFLYGGLPPFFLADEFSEQDFQEWLDSYWAKDILELFKLEKKYSFQKFIELLLAQSSSIFDATRFAKPCEVSRQTITNYLSVLEVTNVIHVIRPFSTHRPTEIISAPKTYAFDTGFVCYARHWISLRNEDRGILWEHLVLNEIHGQLQINVVFYWRDKQGHEIDFIYLKPGELTPIAIECKCSAKEFNASNLQIFRGNYPSGENLVVALDVNRSFRKKIGNIIVKFVSISSMIAELSNY
jgi:predicted AAA+ superfamily ATPase